MPEQDIVIFELSREVASLKLENAKLELENAKLEKELGEAKKEIKGLSESLDDQDAILLEDNETFKYQKNLITKFNSSLQRVSGSLEIVAHACKNVALAHSLGDSQIHKVTDMINKEVGKAQRIVRTAMNR